MKGDSSIVYGIFQLNFLFRVETEMLQLNNCPPVVSSAVIRFQQLLTVDDSYEKNKWNFHLHPKGDMCAKFRLSRLIFIFNSSHQLSTAVKS